MGRRRTLSLAVAAFASSLADCTELSSELPATPLGSLEYKYDPSSFKLPDDAPPMLHGHGLAKDADGTVYFTYVVNATTPGPNDRCLVTFTPDANGVYAAEGKMIGDPALAQGTPHGLRIDSDTSLYHANNDQVVRKTSLEGEIVWSTYNPPNNDSAFQPYMPTDSVIAPPGTNNLYVADGYGSSFIHLMDAESGEWANLTFGGGGGSDHGQLNTPHGINWDPRVELLLISDRSNGRLEYYDLEGRYHSTLVDSGSFLSQPCNVDIDVATGRALVPDLDGPVYVMDAADQLVSTVDVPGDAAETGDDGFQHPHDAIFLPNGDLLVCTWNPGRLGLWRALDQGN